MDGEAAVTLVQLRAGVLGPVRPDLLVCLTPSSPSSFEPAAPGWLLCNGSLETFGVAQSGEGIYPDGCAVLYPSSEPPVATESLSFRELKSGR